MALARNFAIHRTFWLLQDWLLLAIRSLRIECPHGSGVDYAADAETWPAANIMAGSDGTRHATTSQVSTRLPPEVRGYLGVRLRAAYATLVSEPIPDRLLDLLRRLEAKENAS
ncbi:MAG TPA: NepR family anti-sigma factor [Hyphomicrobiaceae bacterium]|nr:NepR family anti-sigma factor [Hyphomicrobiaceae bacterium]